MSDEQRSLIDARGPGVGDRLADGCRVVAVFARVVAGMSSEEFDQWRFGKMLDRNYLRNALAAGERRD